MTDTADFFDEAQAAGVPRDHRGRPLLVPKGLEGKGIRVPYTRASNLASYIDATEAIHRWEMRYLARGLGMRPDLADLAAVETYSTGITDAVHGREKQQSGRRLDDIIERALDTVRIHEKADRGTAVHAATEPHNSGYVPKRLEPAVQSFWDKIKTEAIEIVDTELFTANDATQSAGTFDHTCRFPGHPLLTGLVVCDKKTGRYSPHEWAIQIATYAYGELYDVADDTRRPWPGKVNLQYAAVFHINETDTIIRIIDIEKGWEAAQVAAKARDYVESRDLVIDYTSPSFMDRLAACRTQDDARRLWHSADEGQKALVEEWARENA